jgi:NAD(P)-dependent dehydrogenase (short-subunit alcohol dehydrogenase family)
MGKRTVLITGASSGCGYATGQLFAEKGYQVFGTSRYPDRNEPPPGVTMLQLDVCSDESVQACVAEVNARAGQIDILVNNAAYELAGALEETSLAEAQAQFDTNFFGVVRMVKAVVPSMRERRGGQIINMSSLAGIYPIPFLGFYTATKHALEGYTEVLRLELRSFNIRVSMVEVGNLNTPMKTNRIIASHLIPDYESLRTTTLTRFRKFDDEGPGPELIAREMLKIVESSKPHLRNFAGLEAWILMVMRRLMPAILFERVMLKTWFS